MATGNPRLLTHASDNTLRLYEITELGAVLLNSTSHTTAVRLGFMADGAVEFVIGQSGNTQAGTSYKNLSQVATNSLTGVGTYRGDIFTIGTDLAYLCAITWTSSTITTLSRKLTVSSAGAITQGSYTLGATVIAPTSNYDFEVHSRISPDGTIMVRCRAAGYADIAEFTGTPTAASSTFSGAIEIPGLTTASVVTASAWSSDSRWLLLVESTGAATHIWERSGSTLTHVAQLTNALGTPTAVAISPDTRWVAVAYTSTTVIYHRTGYTFSEAQTVDGTFGALLGFTADSTLLIDAQNRRAFKNVNGTWSEQASLLSALPTGITKQAISPHANWPTGIGRMFDGSVSSILNGTIDKSALKIALYDSTLTFDRTMTARPSSGEVYGSGWPQGGRALTGVAFADTSAAAVALTANAVSQIIVGAALTFRSAIIYDNTSGKPLVFIGFVGDKTADVDAEMTISFGTSGFIVWTP